MEMFRGKKIPPGYNTYGVGYRKRKILMGCVVDSNIADLKCWDIDCWECVLSVSFAKGTAYDFLLHIGKITKEKRLEILLDIGI